MKVAWLLAVFIAIVTYTPRLNLLRGWLCSELEILNWKWTNQMWAKWHMSDTKKSLTQFIFLQIEGHYEVP